MVEGSTQEWFLEIDGKRTGPFDTEQVIGLLADGEIPDVTQIFASTTTAEFITARDLADREQNIQHPAVEGPVSEVSKSFIPPPRPTELQPGHETERPMPQVPSSKPELGLLDALLAAKERKINNTRAMPPEIGQRSPNPFRMGNIPLKAWAILGTAAVLLIGIWGMTHFIRQRTGTVAAAPTTIESKGISSFAPPAPIKNTATEIVSAAPAAIPPAPPSIKSVTAGPPPSNPAMTAPPAVSPQRDGEIEAEREKERERDRDREREREIAANNDPIPPPAPPPPVPGMPASEYGAPPSAAGPGAVPLPPPPLTESGGMHETTNAVAPEKPDYPPPPAPAPPPPLE